MRFPRVLLVALAGLVAAPAAWANPVLEIKGDGDDPGRTVCVKTMPPPPDVEVLEPCGPIVVTVGPATVTIDLTVWPPIGVGVSPCQETPSAKVGPVWLSPDDHCYFVLM